MPAEGSLSRPWSSRSGGSRPPAGSAPHAPGAVEATIAGKGSHGTVCRGGRVDEGDLDRGAAERQAGVAGQMPERPEGPGGRHPPACAERGPRRVRDRPVSTWLYHALKAEALPVVCIDARHAKAALDMAPNKTDANDADGLAQIAEVGFYREVRVKGYAPMLARALVGARGQLLRISIQLS